MQKVLKVLLMVLVAANVVELALFFGIRAKTSMYESGMEFPTPSGFLRNSTFLEAADKPCYILRLAADGCQYCRQDKALFEQLSAGADSRACQVTVLSPNQGDIKPTGAAGEREPLEFVDMKFSQALIPFLTPQTFVLDRNRRLVWHQAGAMNDRALRQGLAALEATN